MRLKIVLTIILIVYGDNMSYPIREIMESAISYARRDIIIKDTFIYNNDVTFANLKIFIDNYIRVRNEISNNKVEFCDIGILLGYVSNGEFMLGAIVSYLLKKRSNGLIIHGEPEDTKKGFCFLRKLTSSSRNRTKLKSIW